MARTTLILSRFAVLAGALVASTSVPTMASAASTATSTGTAMTINGGTGDVDRMAVIYDVIGGTVYIDAINNPASGNIAVNAGTGCSALASTIWAKCAQASLTRVYMNGNDQNDYLVGGAGVDINFDGGTGDDTTIGNSPGNYLNYAGGSGRDTVSYRYGSYPVSASINGTQDDGTLGRENIATDVERIVGSDANDTLSGASATRSTLIGQDGNDSLTAGAAGADLYGGQGNDTLTGGVGNDNFTDYVGTDTFVGGSGNDTFYAEDGDNADTITCGSGFDEVFIDSSDTVTDPANCETTYW